MADNTSNYGLPYPEPRDGVVVHADIERLARRVDTVVPTAVQSARNEAIQDATQKYGGLHQRVSDTETGLTQMIPKDEADQYITPGPPGPGGSIALEETDPGCFADSEITWVDWNAAGTEASVWNPVHNRYELLHTADHIRVDTSVGTRVFVGDVMIQGDTHGRSVKDLIAWDNGWQDSNTTLTVRRSNNVVTVNPNRLLHSAENAGNVTLITLPSGFRPVGTVYDISSLRSRQITLESSGNIVVSNPRTILDYFTVSFVTADPWPTTLPGTPN